MPPRVMQESFALFFDWVGRNENILSGLVAIGVLASLAWAGIRGIGQRSTQRQYDSANGSTLTTPRIDDRPSIPQEIRFCRTSDDKRIAYAITGKGYPMVRSLGWFSNLEVEWNSRVGRSFWERLGEKHQVIRYDGRGIGLSEKTMEFSLETRLRDLEAVIDASGVERFAITATSEGCRTAIRYVVEHPERVSHLVLHGPAVWPPGDTEHREQGRTYLPLIATGWTRPSHRRLFTELFLGGSRSDEEIDYFQRMQVGSASAEVAAEYFRSLGEPKNGFELASLIQVPTLVMHPREDQMCPFAWGQALAAEIPGARFLPLEGDCHWLFMNNDHSSEFMTAIEEFVRTPQA
jgi:pimeloyl-ACP methyl ester carboxylesterase